MAKTSRKPGKKTRKETQLEPQQAGTATQTATATAEGSSAYEVFEEPEALQERLSRGQEFALQNRNTLLAIVVALVVIIAGAAFWQYRGEQQEEKAQAELFYMQFLIEKDSFQTALNGNLNSIGLLRIIDEYSGTQAAQLARYYAGVAYMKQEEYAKALEMLQGFSSNDYLVQARAYALIGDAHLGQDNVDEAVNWYDKAANYQPNEQYSPQYLIKKGLALEQAGRDEAAIAAYQRVVDEYGKSQTAATAKKYQAMLEQKRRNQ